MLTVPAAKVWDRYAVRFEKDLSSFPKAESFDLVKWRTLGLVVVPCCEESSKGLL